MSYHEAAPILNALLAHTGFQAEDLESTRGAAGVHVIGLRYGPRLEKDDRWADKQRRENGRDYDRTLNTTPGPAGGFKPAQLQRMGGRRTVTP